MRTTRIYHPELLKVGEKTCLSDEACHHLLNVLRFKLHDQFTIFDGQNHEYQVVLSHIQKKTAEITVLNIQDVSRESKLHIHLAQGVAKGDRMNFSLQKAVELGVSEYTPLWTQHTAFKWDNKQNEKKLQQWQAIMIAACEQSGRNQIPQLHPIKHIDEFIEQMHAKNRLILDPYQGKHWKNLSWEPGNEATLLIGPEGGLSAQEVQKANAHGFQGLTLGPRILRTETAVISALSILQATKGDL
jgi:16S rRNA (uracil1498-N3)-methyltransferase